jgi:hypothetical protein
MTFRSAVDAWFYAFIAFGLAIVLIATAPLLRSGDPAQLALALGAIVFTVGLPVWILLSTCYDVRDGLLTVRSGPFRWTIPLSEISGVRKSRSLLSSPALSLDRLEIRYGNGKRMLLSPQDTAGFLRAIGHPTPSN